MCKETVFSDNPILNHSEIPNVGAQFINISDTEQVVFSNGERVAILRHIRLLDRWKELHITTHVQLQSSLASHQRASTKPRTDSIDEATIGH